MENARRLYGLSEKSPLLTVPVEMRSRCKQASCKGNECANWRYCGPTSPFGNYLDRLPHSFVSGRELTAKTSSISA